MYRRIRHVGAAIFVMFLCLMVSSSIIQVVQAASLSRDPRDTRAIDDGYGSQRGSILVAGKPIAESVPSHDSYKFQRVYTNGPLYAPVTGFLPISGAATGIEGAMNSTLVGSDVSTLNGRVNALLTGKHAQGDSVELTINPVAQQAAYAALANLRGAVVVIEPSTGRILAMASTPSFDPNTLAAHDTAEAESQYESLLHSPVDPLVNRTIAGNLNPPGSTFKPVVSAAAFGTGRYSPSSPLSNPAELRPAGSGTAIENDTRSTCGTGATTTIATAEIFSCNIPFAELGLQLGGATIRNEANLFGFNQQLKIPMIVAASDYPLYTDPTQLAQSSFGQQDDRVTPLQMAMVSAGIANSGRVMYPNLVDSVLAPNQAPVETFTPRVLHTAMSSTSAAQITQMMVDGVNHGVASNARVPGVSVAGKTGTAQNGPGQPFTLWFTGFAPAANPKYAIAVVVENGGGIGESGFGNTIAAPIARDVLKALLG